MEKLDRLGWAAGQAIRAFDTRIGIRTNSSAGWDALAARLPPLWRPANRPNVRQLISVQFPHGAERPGLRKYYLLYDGPVRLIRTLDQDELLDLFESHLHRLVAAGSTSLFFHAGVVGWNGRAILLPGKTLEGKTTLVTALMRAGAEYYSDEFAVVDRQGWVHPYPKPLGVRANGTIKQERRTAEELGGRLGQKPIPVGAIIASSYSEGAVWQPEQLSAARAAMTLVELCASVQRRPGYTVQTVKKMVGSAVRLKGDRGEAEELAPRLLHQLNWAQP